MRSDILAFAHDPLPAAPLTQRSSQSVNIQYAQPSRDLARRPDCRPDWSTTLYLHWHDWVATSGDTTASIMQYERQNVVSGCSLRQGTPRDVAFQPVPVISMSRTMT